MNKKIKEFFLISLILMCTSIISLYGLSIPGMFEAEAWNTGGEGVGYHDLTGAPTLETNTGGQHIAYIEPGEWLKYDIDASDGNYYIDVYVASADGGGAFHFEINDVNISGTCSFPANGSWDSFDILTIGPVAISGGLQTLKLAMDGSAFNIDKLDFRYTNDTPTPSPSPTPVPTPSPVPPAVPELHTEGIWIKDSAGNPVVIRGVATGDLDAIYKGDRSHLIDTSIFDIIDYAETRLGNVYAIRLDIHPTVNDETGTHGWQYYDPQWYFDNIIDPAVGHVISKGMYAIIDWHYVGVSWTQADVIEKTETFWLGNGSWAGIAAEYANNPNVMFELFNEPGGGEWSSWQATAQGWINGIRNKGANNIIIVGGPSWSSVCPKSNSDLINANNIVYACHIYPSHFQGSNPPNWIDWVKNNAPVMMTEWGYENNGDANVTVGTTSGYGQAYRTWIDSMPHVSWIAWCLDYCYRSTMVDMNWELLGNGVSTSSTRFHGSQFDNDPQATVGDTYENYMGQFTKEWLYDKRNDYSPIIGNQGPTSEPTQTPVITLEPTSAPTPAPGRNAYSTIEAESYNSMSGIQTEGCSEGGDNIGFIENGDWVMFSSVDFGSSAAGFNVRAASSTSGGTIEIRLDNTSGPLVGSCPVSGTGGWQTWTTTSCTVSGASGIRDLYFVFTGGSGFLFNINWFIFTAGTPAPTSAPTPDPTTEPTAAPTAVPTTAPTAAPTAEPTPTPGSGGLVSGQTYVIKAKHSGKSLDVTGVSTADGANIQQWVYSGGNNQKWTITDVGNGQWKIIAVHSGKGLDVASAGTANGDNVQQWPYYGGGCQKWTITEVETGYYKIVNVNSGKCLDVSGVSQNDGANIHQWTYSGTDNQKWSITAP